jgi:SAM-dependent methyltransferase
MLMKMAVQVSGISDQIREHYLIEKELAAKLRNANKRERKNLYTELYDELYRRVPQHPQLVQKANLEEQAKAVSCQLTLLKGFLRPEFTFLEVGPGDCALSLEVARLVRKVYAIDVSKEITVTSVPLPPNFTLQISDGSSMAVPPESIDIAYSNQLIEHLHPDDVLEHLKNIYNSLKRGGIYICITPNRLSGPHDISGLFDKISSGFHLKEYTISELEVIFKAVGFTKVGVLIGATKKNPLLLNILPVKIIEFILRKLPYTLSKYLSIHAPVSVFRVIRVVARK